MAKELGVSKSTVHKDVTNRLKEIDFLLYRSVREQLDYHIKIRSVRGGQALRNKIREGM